MSGPLSKTVWPELPVPDAIKTWLGSLFTLVDSKDSDAPQRVAALYSEDAVVYGMAGKATGTSEIIAAREKSWGHMDDRKHEVLRVYTSKPDFSDLLIVGKLYAKFKNGKEVTDEFIANITFQGDTNTEPKGSLYRIWADSAPWVNAMKG